MLSFIDEAADGAKAERKEKARRFHVRRRTGKIFGPFEEGVVLKMLESNQLSGNEDVSADGDSWSPMGTVPPFSEVIQQMMESPASGTP